MMKSNDASMVNYEEPSNASIIKTSDASIKKKCDTSMLNYKIISDASTLKTSDVSTAICDKVRECIYY